MVVHDAFSSVFKMLTVSFIISCYQKIIHVQYLFSIYLCKARGILVFSKLVNWDLTAKVTVGPWKGTKMKPRI